VQDTIAYGGGSVSRDEIVGLILACIVVGGAITIWAWMLVTNLWFGGTPWPW